MKYATQEHIREARAALASIDGGSRIRTRNETTGREASSAGIFHNFSLSRDQYVADWLLSVYGERMEERA